MGRPPKTWDSEDYSLPMGDISEPQENIAKRLDKTFRVLDKLLKSVVEGNARALLISGATGCGKSYSVEKSLIESQVGNKYKIIGGTKTGVELYKALYNHRKEGEIVVFDDCDSVYFDLIALNTLKHALDTRKKRVLSWSEQSWALLKTSDDGEPYPSEFIYEGSAIFCTNIDLHNEIRKNKRHSKHVEAVLNRGTYLDLGIHTKREILVRIWQVIKNTPFLVENEISIQNANKILAWIKENIALIQRPSIRLVITLDRMIKSDPEGWIETAEVTTFRR